MERKYTSFGVKYQNILVGWKILNYGDILVETSIYINYAVLSIVIYIYMLVIELFYLTQLCSFIGCFFYYLPIFLPLQVCGISFTRFKEFRKIWSFSFVDPLVKGTNNFWRSVG